MTSNVQVITRAVTRWAERHPKPDEPTLMSSIGTFSPRQLAHEVARRSQTGRFFVKMIMNSASEIPLPQLLRAFEGTPVTTGSGPADRPSRRRSPSTTSRK